MRIPLRSRPPCSPPRQPAATSSCPPAPAPARPWPTGLALADTLLAGEEKMPSQGPLALVIAPTRELALQVQRELEWLYADTGAVVAATVGGMDARAERRLLERGAHIVVGTPGRLRDHIERRALDFTHLRAAVLDEADEMLDLGFREDLEFILEATPDQGAARCCFPPPCPRASSRWPGASSATRCGWRPAARSAAIPTSPIAWSACRRPSASTPSSTSCARASRPRPSCSATRATACATSRRCSASAASPR